MTPIRRWVDIASSLPDIARPGRINAQRARQFTRSAVGLDPLAPRDIPTCRGGLSTLAGTVAKEGAGPGVTISFLVAGIASACAALSYAEFGDLIPQAGSAYTYGYAVLGELVGWLIGWDLLLEYTAIVAVVAIAVSGYLNFLLDGIGVQLPHWMLGAPSTGHGHKFDLFAALLCLFVAALLNRVYAHRPGSKRCWLLSRSSSSLLSSSSAPSTSHRPTTPLTCRRASVPRSPGRRPCSSRYSATTQ